MSRSAALAVVFVAVLATACRGAEAAERAVAQPPAAPGVADLGPAHATTDAPAPATTTAAVTTSPTTTTAPITTTTSATTTSTTTTSTSTSTTTTSTTVPALRTTCREVVEIGDSTGLALDTLPTELAKVGVEVFYPDNSGGRSMVERLGPQQNAVEVAAAVRANAFGGCWLLLLGTNDAANVAAGAPTGLDERIDRLMAVIGDAPVLWVNAASIGTTPYYSAADLQAFNDALARATFAYPNLRAFDWSAAVRPEWFAADGLHYSADGRVWRAALIAQALARAFPA